MTHNAQEHFRIFFAVPIPDEIKAQLSESLEGFFGAEGVPGRPVKPTNWHLTLRFLGDTLPEDCARIQEAVASSDLGGSFVLRLDRLGGFPKPTRASVMWVGLADPEARLPKLAADLNSVLANAGVPEETRPYVGHLTLSRIRRPINLEANIEGFQSPANSFPVDNVVLYRSHLGSGPARYEVLQRYSLV